MQAATEKARLRAELLAARRARPAGDVEIARAAVRERVLRQARLDGWTCVAAYEPLRTEPGSIELLAGLAALGVRVLVPITQPDRDLDWTVWGADGDGLGPAAIATADAVLVPALAVARDGTRLGRGGGSYDRALRRARPAAPRIALLFDGELVAALPREEWDEPVTEVVTPAGPIRL
ncbi:MAG TPA: 5-formyltetrahydrofolate cyclo-ligase [Jatrophihabitans sp.]|jgi:5-formyltetrahydrofolate cyclo-ligase|uniref:5-formyltetrahydrofolate cyclo-ligase n=1 Tax=Jatrophihabitans sp. TaxID=1932789 RepID=UPI002DFC429F|nr:5-formyltetrahydrofolate cyclo-ligase [Jatrophihabitans sp.]